MTRVRLRDLDPTGWALLVAGSWALFYAITTTASILVGDGGAWTAVIISGAVGALFLWIVDHIARPELVGTCDHCGTPIEINTGTEGADMALTVPRAGSPERVGEDALSVVRSRNYEESVACCPACAQAIWDRNPTPTHPATSVEGGRDSHGAERSWTGEEGVVADGGDNTGNVVEVID